MPNGHDKNWVRFCAAVDGFFVKHGHWPTRIRTFRDAVDDLVSMFSEADFEKISEKIEVVSDEAPFVAEDAAGNSYSYGDEGFPDHRPARSAEEWLGVEPTRPGFDFF